MNPHALPIPTKHELQEGYCLQIVFDHAGKKRYHVTPLLKKERFAPLRNRALFKVVQVDLGELRRRLE